MNTLERKLIAVMMYIAGEKGDNNRYVSFVSKDTYNKLSRKDKDLVCDIFDANPYVTVGSNVIISNNFFIGPVFPSSRMFGCDYFYASSTRSIVPSNPIQGQHIAFDYMDESKRILHESMILFNRNKKEATINSSLFKHNIEVSLNEARSFDEKIEECIFDRGLILVQAKNK